MTGIPACILGNRRYCNLHSDVASPGFIQVELGSALKGEPDDEAEAVYGRTDNWVSARARAACENRRYVPQARDQRGDFLQRKSKFGGLDVSEATRLKQFDRENTRLKKLLADSMLDNAALRAWLFRGVLH
jgi:hypothetical protein